jgi:hypothetical protein
MVLTYPIYFLFLLLLLNRRKADDLKIPPHSTVIPMSIRMERATVDSARFVARLATFLLTIPVPFLLHQIKVDISDVSRVYIHDSTIVMCHNILESLKRSYATTNLRHPLNSMNFALVLLCRPRMRYANTDEFTPIMCLAAAVWAAHKFEWDYHEKGAAFWTDLSNIDRGTLTRAECTLLHGIYWDVWVKRDEGEDFRMID